MELKEELEWEYIANKPATLTTRYTRCKECGRIFDRANPHKKAAVVFCAACSLKNKEWSDEQENQI